MIDLTQLRPSTVDTLKFLYKNHKDTIDYMQKYGTLFEKSIAAMILEAAEGGKGD
jgi:hypothetical protein